MSYIDLTKTTAPATPASSHTELYVNTTDKSLHEVNDAGTDNAFIIGSAPQTLAAGTTSVAPLTYASGTNLTSAAVGATEFDGVQFYQTISTAEGRGSVPVEQYFKLTSNGSTISTIANFFGSTSNISTVASAHYEIEIFAALTITTTDPVVWTIDFGAAPTVAVIDFAMSPAAGVTSTPAASELEAQIYTTSQSNTITTANLTTGVNHIARFKIMLQNGTGTSVKIQLTKNTAGTATPLAGSFWKCRRLSTGNVGTFAA